jgi:cobalt-zinc-cadmium efflux system outer membrane protein
MNIIQITSLLLVGLASVQALAGERLTFDAFVKAAREQNLSLKVESAKSEASRANSRGLTIPPPMVGFMRMTDQSGSSAGGFEVNQTIPFPSKIYHDHSARKLEAEAQEESRLGMESEILGKARLVYFNLWASQQRKDALKEKKSVIENHIRLSRAGVRGDSFLRIHLLKAESDLDLLENEILAIDQEIKEKQAAVAEFLNIDASSFHPDLEEPPLAVSPNENTLAASHQLEAARLSFESFKVREQAAGAAWFPDLFLRYKETGQTQLMPKLSEIMVGVSLPFLFPWEPSAASSKTTAFKLQSELEFEREKRKIASEGGVLISRATALKKQLDNISQRLLPRAEKRMKLVHNLAPRDMETLQDHRETMEAFPDLKLKALELRAQYETTIAELQKYERGQR